MASVITRSCLVRRLGHVEYPRALALQEDLVRRRAADEIADTLLLLEHPHVVTKGSGARDAHVLVDAAQQAKLGLSVLETTRGGDVTYHGPGQLVGYPILRLTDERRDAHRYLRDLEEVLLRTLASLGIEGHRDEQYTGVWVGDAKVAAIGVRLTRWITSHGFALNVDPDLRYFETIVPCGIVGKGVTSLRRLGVSASMAQVEQHVVEHFGAVFDRAPQWTQEAS
jgi:lipoyl(octanoyl) transferase